MLHQLKIHREIISDLLTDHLAPLPGQFACLAFIASLRDPITGIYAHHALAVRYPESSVHQALEKCHEEIFERLLEFPLSQQVEDLKIYLHTLPGDPQENIRVCEQTVWRWTPERTPSYLQKLFASNVHALCELLSKPSKARIAT